MKEFLSRAGHTFTVKQVEEDHTAYSELIALGFRAVPVTVIGRETVKGYDASKLAEALASAGS